MIRYLAAGVMLMAVQVPGDASAQAAWCDKNCVSLCRATAGKGYTGSVQQCMAQFNCPSYAGKTCAPASVVQWRAESINKGGR